MIKVSVHQHTYVHSYDTKHLPLLWSSLQKQTLMAHGFSQKVWFKKVSISVKHLQSLLNSSQTKHFISFLSSSKIAIYIKDEYIIKQLACMVTLSNVAIGMQWHNVT